jgi:signal transduction histidine kinase
VLRYRLYDIDLIFNRALVYGALTLCIAAIYVLVVGSLGALLQGGQSLPLSLLAAGLVALAFQPLRAWLQRGVNRLLYGERDEPYAVLARLGQRLQGAIDPGEVLPSLLATVRDALRLPYAAVALRREGGLTIAAAAGKPAGEPLTLPLTYQGEQVGALIVSPRAPGEAWTAADLRLLEDLAGHAGVAVHGVRLMAELQRAREQLVLAREEERRRLRNDLHDGVAPSLAALALTAATVSELIERDPAGAAEVAKKLRAAIRATVGDVRRLVYDLRPATLDELGLVEAIREQAARLTAGGGPEVLVEAPEQLPPLPAAVEVAAFRIVQEALANVLRHASAGRCALRVACSAGRALEIEVRDDGVGLPEARRAGVGLRSMQERAAELGGVCVVGPAAPRGTRVAVWLPIGAGREVEQGGDNGAATGAGR